MLTWCKLHTDILGDAKLQRAARKGAKWLVLLPWLMAWARAHDETDCGRLVLDGEPAEPEDVAAQLPGVKPAAVRACLAEAEDIGVLVRDPDGALRFAAWDLRSGKGSSRPSDAPAAVRERVRKHRETRRAVVTETAGNAQPVTTGNDGNALPNATDIEKELERELEGEKDQGQKGDADAPPAPVLVRTWADDVVACLGVWQERKGLVHRDRFFRAFKPLFDRPAGEAPPYPLPVVLDALKWAIATRDHPTKRHVKFSPETFVADLAQHVGFLRLDIERRSEYLPRAVA